MALSAIPLVSLMARLRRAMSAASVELALEEAALDDSSPETPGRLRQWVDGNADPVHDVVATPALLDRLQAAASANATDRLVAMATAYGDLMEPLLPIWHDFVVASARLEGPPALLLRDALQFWPFFEALGREPWFIAYSRKDERRGAPARWCRLGAEAEVPRRPVIVDSGIYGTLVASLIEARQLVEPTVMFLTSRNPYIRGHANARIDAAVRKGAWQDPDDAIRLCDTAESVLKAFEILDDPHEPLTATIPNGTAFALTCELFRRAFDYGRRRGPEPLSDKEWSAALAALRAGPSWFCHEPVAAWPEGLAFVAGWRLGCLPPLTSPQDLLVRGAR